jgi:hypothetical protein
MNETFKTLVWPGVTIIAMFIFKPAINGILARVRAIKMQQFELNADPIAAQQSETKVPELALGEQQPGNHDVAPELAKRREEVMKVDVSPIVLEQERLIKKDIESLNIPQSHWQRVSEVSC